MAEPKKYNTNLTETQLNEIFDNALNKFPARFTENENKITKNETAIGAVEERLTVVEGKKTVLLYSENPGVTTVTVDTGDYAYYKVFFTGEGGSYFMECDCVKGNNTIPISMLYNNVLNVGRINCVIDDTTVSISSMTGFAITADGNTASTLNFRLRKIYGVKI